MLIFHVLLLTIFCCTFALNDYEITVPTFLRVSLLEPVGLFVQWRTIPSFQINPIVGYKVRLSEINEDLQGTYTILHENELVIISDERPEEPYNTEKQQDKFREFKVPAIDIKDDLSIKIRDNIKYNRLYEVRVLAYREDKDGPITDPIRAKIVKGDDYVVLVQRESASLCIVSMSSNSTPENEVTYYHSENVYL
ncbi:unnamed protein product [Leptosia nina]|uniref:Uncharacterized protein n=1 Tax=Leptosia nina TaxID=320188 RepID=A0AAV1J7N2_9NEOP